MPALILSCLRPDLRTEEIPPAAIIQGCITRYSNNNKRSQKSDKRTLSGITVSSMLSIYKTHHVLNNHHARYTKDERRTTSPTTLTLPPRRRNLFHRLHSPSPLTINEMRDAVFRQPLILRHDKVRDEREDGDGAHDDGGIYQQLAH